jgi:hypothetical protein
VSWLVTTVLSFAIGYVLVDALICAVVLLRGRDLEWDLSVPRSVFLAVLAVVLSETVFLVVVAAYVVLWWPALAVFPALGACWVGVDLLGLMTAVRGGNASRVTVTSPLTVALGISLAACLIAVQITIAGLRT